MIMLRHCITCCMYPCIMLRHCITCIACTLVLCSDTVLCVACTLVLCSDTGLCFPCTLVYVILFLLSPSPGHHGTVLWASYSSMAVQAYICMHVSYCVYSHPSAVLSLNNDVTYLLDDETVNIYSYTSFNIIIEHFSLYRKPYFVSVPVSMHHHKMHHLHCS